MTVAGSSATDSRRPGIPLPDAKTSLSVNKLASRRAQCVRLVIVAWRGKTFMKKITGRHIYYEIP